MAATGGCSQPAVRRAVVRQHPAPPQSEVLGRQLGLVYGLLLALWVIWIIRRRRRILGGLAAAEPFATVLHERRLRSCSSADLDAGHRVEHEARGQRHREQRKQHNLDARDVRDRGDGGWTHKSAEMTAEIDRRWKHTDQHTFTQKKLARQDDCEQPKSH